MRYKIADGGDAGSYIRITYDHFPDYHEDVLDIRIYRWAKFQPDDFTEWLKHPGLVEIFCIIDIDQYPYNLYGERRIEPSEYVILRFRDKKSMMHWKLKFPMPENH